MEAGIPGLEAVREAHPSELAVLLSTLTVDDVASMDPGACEAVVVATQRVASWSHALQARALDRFAEHVTDQVEVHVADLRERGVSTRSSERVVPVPEPDTIAASSLAPLLNIAPRTMRTRLNRARILVELPRTFALSLAGELEPWRADAVIDAARDVAPSRLEEFESRLYATDTTGLPKPRLRERALRAAEKADREGVQRARAVAPRRRGLRWGPSEVPGLMRWTADIPDDASRHLAAAVDALAHEYLAADAHARARDAEAATDPSAGGARRGRLSMEAARLDAMVDLVRARSQVTTTVELVVPAQSATTPMAVTRRDHLDVIRDTLSHPSAGHGSGQGVEVVRVVDPITVDLVAGAVTRATLAAGELERDLALRLGTHLETTGNPFLTTTQPAPHSRREPNADTAPQPHPTTTRPAPDDGERVWFVPGIVEVPGTTGLLPQQVVALLTDLDTRLRITSAEPGTADGPPGRRTRYRPGRRLADRVRARDGHCRFPGCSVPAARCDLDHVTPHPRGPTEEANLHSLCRSHHGFKHHAGWLLAMTPDGTCTWTAPTGRTHTTHPATRTDHAA